MDAIEQKLEELWNLLQTIPEDCKGEGKQNSKIGIALSKYEVRFTN